MLRKTFGLCVQAMRDFLGSDVLHQLSSDNAPELIRTAAELMVPLATSTPYHSTSNGNVENIIGQMLSGSRALLQQSGLPATWWPWAAPSWCSMHNILGKPGAVASPYFRRHGTAFPGQALPFRAPPVQTNSIRGPVGMIPGGHLPSRCLRRVPTCHHNGACRG